jgi:hypothetical protein
MEKAGRYPEFVALKVPTALLQKIRHAAAKDDRTVSGYLRRIIAAAVRKPSAKKQESR